MVRVAVVLWLLASFDARVFIAHAQTTAFTYQGRLNDTGSPANGTYDFTFTVFDSSTGGNQQGPVVTNLATAVNGGLFTVTLDFGNQFPGASRWLEISVCTNGANAFATLVPRQLLTPTPYALTAGGILPGGIPAGIYTNAVVFNNAGNQFFGNGAGVTNLPFASFSPAVQTQLTNAAALAALVQTNLGALAAAVVDTNLFTTLSQNHLLVSSFTNLPPYLLNSPYYFSPAKGASYVQQAINALPSYAAANMLAAVSLKWPASTTFPAPCSSRTAVSRAIS